MTPENLVEELQESLGEALESVVLYGSAAAGDHKGKESDYNVMVIIHELDVARLDAVASVARAWTKAGNPPPLMFTMRRLAKSADVFPLEMLDIMDSRKILFGSDPLEKLEISDANLRLELEHELKGKLIQLRERYLLASGNPKAVLDLMVQSLSTFLVLFRGFLRLLDSDVPACKMDALNALAGKLEIDTQVFVKIDQIKSKALKPKEAAPFAWFDEYLKTIEKVVDAVDDYKSRQSV